MQLKFIFRKFIFFTSILFSACTVNKNRGLVKSDEVYTFINFYLKTQEETDKLDPEFLDYNNDYADINIILDKKDFNEMIGPQISFDTLLNRDDIIYMKKQINYWKNDHRLNVKYLGIYGNNLLSESLSATSITRLKYNVLKLGIPLFSINKKVVLIYTEMHCGIDCGAGYITIFEKQPDGKWKRVSVKSVWIS
ncbi:hypothetical protein [Mucilaginibacter phyllosphaerae]|uniref:Uncharacterized protein n=1 Tax=Mucilaginibacter phyllosphaerae TaxID=1812349 RepID=A0A4Y8AJV3_9SPHI|nr:hypothetical protein [Mucilaginibacter phyllosphaerae]MBB3967637.1 hypothetical protein [Mucilaginibacter phyllosphaerae]TEW69306.1 hypothetical protein E2R65_03830 [Mucilaginibacter phyllosphaerae]